MAVVVLKKRGEQLNDGDEAAEAMNLSGKKPKKRLEKYEKM